MRRVVVGRRGDVLPRRHLRRPRHRRHRPVCLWGSPIIRAGNSNRRRPPSPDRAGRNQGTQLQFFADEVDLYFTTNRIVASGNVVFTNADGRIAAERVEFNTATGIGTFYDASGIMSLGAKAGVSMGANIAAFGGQDPDVYFYGQTLEKLGPRKCRITRGGFTTCVQPTPRWEVTSGSVVLNLDDYAIANNTVLRVKGVPVFYLPRPLLSDSERSARDRISAPDLRRLDAPRPVAEQRHSSGPSTAARTRRSFTTGSRIPAWGEGSEYRYVAGLQSAGNVRAYRFVQHETSFTQSGQTTTLPANISYEFTGAATQALGGDQREGGCASTTFQTSSPSSSTIRTSTSPRVAAG